MLSLNPGAQSLQASQGDDSDWKGPGVEKTNERSGDICR